MKNQISTNVAAARTARRRKPKDAHDLFVACGDRIGFVSFWASVILMEDHPMRPLVKVLIEKNEKIDFRTAALLFHAYNDKLSSN